VARVISFINQKGGTGKTTATVNCGAGLARSGYKTLLVDFDPQANATISCAVDQTKLEKSIYEVLLGELSLSKIVRQTSVPKLTLAPARSNLSNTTINLANEPRNQYKLMQALQQVRNTFDYILIDCPHSLNLLSINALTCSDGIIIPTLCDYLSLEGLKQLMESINQVKAKLNPKVIILGILPNMTDFRRNLDKESLSLIKSTFKDLVFNTIVKICVSLAEAPSYGKNIFDHAPLSSGAQAYKKLIKEIIKRGDKQWA
jgi:chromosome partitioning protein